MASRSSSRRSRTRAASGSARRAKQAELSGSGPAAADHQPHRLPGAVSPFALFGEVLIVGVIVTVLALPIVTLPLALAVGARHQRRFLRAESSTLGDVATDLRAGILPSLGVGLLMLAIAVMLTIDFALAIDGVIPGSALILAVGIIGAVALLLAVVSSAGAWDPKSGWRAAIGSAARSWRSDPVGAAYLVVAIGFVVVVSWQLIPLVIPGLGCLALAIVAIPERRGALPAE